MNLENVLLGTKYGSRLEIIKIHSEILFKKDVPFHKFYTLHGIDHCKSIISKLNNLVEGIDKDSQLTIPEIFHLLSSVYLHDAGMLVPYADDEVKAKEAGLIKGISYAKEDLIRDEHNFRSGKYIVENRGDLKLDHVESICVKLICQGHRVTDLDSNDYNDKFVNDDCIRIRFLAALLRLADELDVSYYRAPEELMDLLIEDMPEFSQLQWLKHYYTNGVRISSHEINSKKKIVIEIQTQYPNLEKGKKITDELVFKPIQKTLATVDRILLEYGLNIILNPPELIFNDAIKAIPKKIYDRYLCQEFKVSMQIPQTKGFVGRCSELIKLTNLLSRNIIIIEGIAGIGKTYIASKFAEELKGKYDIYWYGNLNQYTTIRSVITQLSLFLRESGRTTLFDSINLNYETDILISILRNELNDNKIVIFFDNYQKAEDELNPLIEQLFSIESSKIILITRQKPAFYNVLYELNNIIGKIKINSWSYDDTFDMFNKRSIDIADKSILMNIHERLLGHPQYLNFFCILSQKSRPSELLSRLPLAEEDAHSYLESEVYNSLKEDEKNLIKIISVYRIPERIDAFYIVNSIKDIEVTLNSLINKFLVNEVGVDKYFVHEILSAYCLSDSKKRKILRDYHNNAAKYYLSKDKDPESLLEASYHYTQSEDREKSAEIIINNARDFLYKGFWSKIEELLNDAIATLSKKRHDKYSILGVGYAHLYIGEFYCQRGDLNLALEQINESSKLFIRAGNKNLFTLYTAFGEIYQKMGEFNTSLGYLIKSLKFAEKNNNEYTIAVATLNIGTIHHGRGEYEKALELYLKSVEIFKKGNYTKNLADAYGNIADIYYALNNFNDAYIYIEMSIKLFQEIGATYWVAKLYLNYASYCIADPSKRDKLDKVLLCLEKNLDTFNMIGYTLGEADTYSKIALIYKIKKDTLQSNLYYNKAKESLEAVVKKNSVFADKIKLCEIYINLNEYDKAIKILKGMLSTIDDNHHFKFLISCYMSLVLFLTGSSDEAITFIQKVIQKESIITKKYSWDCTDILLTIDEKLESSESAIMSDLIYFMRNQTRFPLIRFGNVKIINSEVGMNSEVFHPFIGLKTIYKDDICFRSILSELMNEDITINTDEENIMGIKRDTALMVLGYLYNKNYLEVNELSTNFLKVGLSVNAIDKLKTFKSRVS